MHTHVNPIIDQVAAPTPTDLELYPETYRRHYWPKVQGYREATKDVFSRVESVSMLVAKHLDAHVTKTLGQDSMNYQRLEEMIKTS